MNAKERMCSDIRKKVKMENNQLKDVEELYMYIEIAFIPYDN